MISQREKVKILYPRSVIRRRGYTQYEALSSPWPWSEILGVGPTPADAWGQAAYTLGLHRS